MYIDQTRSVNHPDMTRCDGRGVLIITSSFGVYMSACRHLVKYHCLCVCWADHDAACW